MQLPGIGPYTARAVLAIAFGEPVAALDVNIRRVVGRAWLGGATPPAKDLQSIADDLVPNGAAAAWTHALMDIGAAFCRVGEPRCDGCPLQSACLFRAGALAEPSLLQGTAAGSTARSSRAASSSITFERTNRWLRGRILDALRDAPDGTWLAFEDPIGGHDAPAVQAAIATLAAEGMIEAAGSRARLQLA
jgi:A/G-specific adenine glycosylase